MKQGLCLAMLNKAVFAVTFAIMSVFIALNLGKINSDIYGLIGFDKESKEIFTNLNESLRDEIIFASNDKMKFENFIAECENSGIFSEILYKINSIKDYQKELEIYKIALLDDESVNLLENNATAFFTRSQADFFNKFKPLSASQDFFSLTLHSEILKGGGWIKFDMSENRFYGEIESQKYYFAKAKLEQIYDENVLLNLTQIAKNSEILISGGAIYSVLGKNSAKFESAFMGSFSLIICAILLFLAFKNARIFTVVGVVAFGLVSGVFALFLFFESVHSISVVISTSLIGLMLDFSAHWLGSNANSLVKKQSIKDMKKIFLLGFFITAGGYAVFLFSSFDLLLQIAVFAIFALLGAFLFSYFMLPEIFDNCEFKSSKIWDKFLQILVKFSAKFKFVNLKFNLVCIAILTLFLYNFAVFKDDISEYSSMDKTLLQMSAKLSTLSSQSYDLAVLDSGSNVPNTLVSSGIIGSYLSAEKFIQSPKTQEKIIEIFANSNADLMKGINPNLVQKELDKVANSQVFTQNEVLNSSLFLNLKNLQIDGKNIVFLYDIKDKIALKNAILADGGAYLSFKDSANSAFLNIKINAIYLKIIAYALAFLLLCYFFGLKISANIVTAVFLSNLITLFILSIFGFSINIFVIFGLILAGAVGVDYMIFALNSHLQTAKKIFGISVAALTSMVSFFALSFSGTSAAAVFGLSVAINIAICAFLAGIYANKFTV
ncbi:MAG: hypothetical protein II923_00620 [Campylobacter sp.]|nr:hypothetical protein [Campylobacter sp.]